MSVGYLEFFYYGFKYFTINLSVFLWIKEDVTSEVDATDHPAIFYGTAAQYHSAHMRRYRVEHLLSQSMDMYRHWLLQWQDQCLAHTDPLKYAWIGINTHPLNV